MSVGIIEKLFKTSYREIKRNRMIVKPKKVRQRDVTVLP